MNDVTDTELRTRYVTDLVAEWVVNDGDYYNGARAIAGLRSETVDVARGLGEWLEDILRTSAGDVRYQGSKPWRVGQELAPNDYARIRWDEVRGHLLAE